MGEPWVVRTPSTGIRSLMGTGRPASGPRAEKGSRISRSACARARSKHSVGKALTEPSTAAIRASSASSRSWGVTSPRCRRSTIVTASALINSLWLGIDAHPCSIAIAALKTAKDRTMPLSNLAVRDIETVVHPYTNLAGLRDSGPLVVEHGKGVFVHDSEGKSYIDGMAGLWCVSLGYGNEELVEAAAAQRRKLSFGHLFSAKSHDPATGLPEKLKEIAPVPSSTVFFASAGSEANDTQVKLVWYMNNALGRPNKKKIVSRLRGYHGVTVAAASLTGLPNNHIDFDLPIRNILHTSCPHHYRFARDGESEEEFATRLAAELDELIVKEGPETVAAFIAEPVMGAGGVIVPPRTYFPKIMAVCAKYDVYMIADEVICAFGRLGTMFGSQALGFEPHGLSIAKALSSAYVPIAGVMVPEIMYQALLTESRKVGMFAHGFTYSGHPVAAAVALKTLEIYARDRVIEAAGGKGP